ncbi:uncharacterized protein K444DRAFT_626088 [Hyaloscypha bicolor E]|uniref:Tc1-like transposase DDE domain-containing protein n=1 Tax=Hyaloscypha bicolor E TaxID=1095630 RepID=A0A2J6TMG3_9HELO|nr:uncharacterized protein K444DRAFT_626088 [Hyaloscypha bicolor E]PMD64215.1 hypothetical protein K444DRAFT_626088 [Hyaloscypha bicolor E]
MGLKCKESTFEKLMYKFRSHHLPGAEKPELNEGCMKMRRELATLLLGMDLKNVVFIDEANARSQYGKQSYWYTPEEYFHTDVKSGSTKQAYQKAEFVRAIKWGERPGPYRSFLPETDAEKEEAKLSIKKLQDEELPRLRTEFEAQEAVKDKAAAVKGQKRRGKRPSLDVYIRKHQTKRGDRLQGSGIDWFRITDKYIQPLLDPWIKELQAKDDLRRQTRQHNGGVKCVLDNASAHRSKFTNQILRLLDIARIVWSPQLPDLNAIEHAWDYVRKRVQERVPFPVTEEVIAAWEEEWQRILQEEINKWIECLEGTLKKVLGYNGDNFFHG